MDTSINNTVQAGVAGSGLGESSGRVGTTSGTTNDIDTWLGSKSSTESGLTLKADPSVYRDMAPQDIAADILKHLI